MLKLALFLGALCLAQATIFTLPTLVKFSTNVAELEVGKPFAATCDIQNLLKDGKFEVDFKFNQQVLASFYNNRSEILDIKFSSSNATNIEASEINRSFNTAGHYLSGKFTTKLTLKAADLHGNFSCAARKSGAVYGSNLWTAKMKTVVAPPKPNTVVKFSSSVAEVEVGQSFIATCDVQNWLFDSNFEIDFNFNKTLLAVFYNQPGPALDIKFRNTNAPHFEVVENSPLLLTTSGHYISGKFSIKLTLTTPQAGGHFQCVGRKPGSVYGSNWWTPAVKEHHKNASLHFATNVTQVLLGKPFTASCVVSNFVAENKNYAIKFMRTSGLLGAYEVKAPTQLNPKPHAMFVKSDFANVTVQHGVHFTYPTFEVQIVSHSDVTENYWCQLEEQASNKSVTIKSNLVPNVPTLVYSSSLQADHSRTGRCSISGNFVPEGKEYSVKFYMMSSSLAQPLATYKFAPNQPDDFTMHNSGLKIVHGENVAFPNFEIFFPSPTIAHGDFWCMLAIGTEGQKNYQRFKSNELRV